MMGGFAIPSLPSMPSMSSVRSMLNTSPPLVYPSSNTTPRPRGLADDTPTRRRSLSRASSHLPASPSVMHDRPEWEAIARGRRGSIHSLDGRDNIAASMPSPSRRAVAPLPVVTGGGSPVRPSHRRAQSAIPRRPHNDSRDPGPLGRLHEISRNPLASSSCISLPTLCEMGPEVSNTTTIQTSAYTDVFGGSSAPTSPLAAPRGRRSSKATPIEPLDLTSPTSSLSISSLGPKPSSHSKTQSRTRSVSSVPPPNAMLPPPLPPLLRPPISPRSWSVQDVRPPPRTGAPSRLGRRSSIASTSSVSDVAVLATWSFPASPHKRPTSRQSDRLPDQPSDRLRERLKLLSSLDTSVPPSQSAASASTPPRNQASQGMGLGRSSSTKTPRGPGQGHRHTHSSPNLLPLYPVSLSGPPGPNGPLQSHAHPLLPPPRPMRRPTTSRLRQPNLLSMPVDTVSNPFVTHHSQSTGTTGTYSTSGTGAGCSSPGSMTSGSSSDVDALPSPTGSIVSLPPIQQGTALQERSGLKSWMRRTSISSLLSISDNQSIKGGCTGSRQGEEGVEELDVKMKGNMYISTVQGTEGTSDGSGEESEDERYLTLDDI